MYYWYIKRLLVRVCLTYQWSLDWCVFVILEASYNDGKRGECNAKWESTAEMKDMPNYLKSALESRNIAEKVTSNSQYQFKTLCIISCMTFFPIFVLICCRGEEICTWMWYSNPYWMYVHVHVFNKTCLCILNLYWKPIYTDYWRKKHINCVAAAHQSGQ